MTQRFSVVRVLGPALVLASLLMAFSMGSARTRRVLTPRAKPEEAGYVPMARLRPGTERVAIFIGSSSCGAAQEARIVEGLPDLWHSLDGQARAAGMSFATIGVALDWRPGDGLAFLQKLGWFDEVAAGRNWLNQGAYRFLFHDLPGQPALPQILLIERDVAPELQTVAVRSERVVMRKVGVQEIVEWIEASRRTSGS